MVLIVISHEGYFVVDINSANWAALVCLKPLVHAFGVEQVHTGKSTHVFTLFEIAQTNRAFVRRVIAVRFSEYKRGTFESRCNGNPPITK